MGAQQLVRARPAFTDGVLVASTLRLDPEMTGIATLGPPGTSSERAAEQLAARLGRSACPVTLHGSYEEAAAAVLRGESARLLVANAYHGVCAFYMDPRLTLELAFVQDTPKYGIAARAREPIPLTTRVATHPAPEDLVAQLLPSGYRVSAITYARSTSAAAAQVTSGDADLALTAEPAATLYGLRFISATRPIRMLWSVFVRRTNCEESM